MASAHSPDMAPAADLPHTAFSRVVFGAVRSIGIAVSFVWALLVLAIVAGVAMRYGLHRGTVLLEEVQWHLNAVGIAIAISFAMTSNSHIRVNLFSDSFSLRTRAWIELVGLCLFLVPYCYFTVKHGIDFATNSFLTGEVSVVPSGLSHRWIIKSFLPIAFLLLGVMALAQITRCLVCIAGRTEPW